MSTFQQRLREARPQPSVGNPPSRSERVVSSPVRGVGETAKARAVPPQARSGQAGPPRNELSELRKLRERLMGRSSPQARTSSEHRASAPTELRRFSTRDIERVPVGDGTLSRLRLGDRNTAATNTFLRRHSPTVLHDTRRDVFYRITDEGLRRITNEDVLKTLRERARERELREEGRLPAGRPGDHRRPPAVVTREDHDHDHGRPGGHRWHPRHDDDDHFFFGLGIGDWYYPYGGFYFGYHRGHPHHYWYAPYLYRPWYYRPWPYYRAYYYDDWAYLDLVISPVAYCWWAPSLVVVPPPVYPVVWGSLVTLNLYSSVGIYGTPPTYSAGAYSAAGQVVAQTGVAPTVPQQSPAPAPSESSAENPPTTGGQDAVDASLVEEFDALAEEAFKQKRYELAAKYWRHALVEDPENGLLLLLMGQALFAAGKYHEAAGAVQAGLALLDEKDWGVVVRNWRELYPDPAEYTRQLRALEAAIRQNLNDPALRFLVGYHYGFLGYPADAVRELGYLKKLAPQDKIGLRLLELMEQELAKKQGGTSSSGQPTEQTTGGGTGSSQPSS